MLHPLSRLLSRRTRRLHRDAARIAAIRTEVDACTASLDEFRAAFRTDDPLEDRPRALSKGRVHAVSVHTDGNGAPHTEVKLTARPATYDGEVPAPEYVLPGDLARTRSRLTGEAIATYVRRTRPPAQPPLARIEPWDPPAAVDVARFTDRIPLTATVADETGHIHIWDGIHHPTGRLGWTCDCSAIKCDLPRCVRPADHPAPHHIDGS